MFSVLVIIAIIVSILLILVVSIQESKGGGLSSSYASANALMGVHKTTDAVEKTTWGLAALLVVLCIGTAYTIGGNNSSTDQTVNDAATKKSLTTPTAVPTAPATQSSTQPASAPKN